MNRSPRVMHLITGLGIGGAENMLLKLVTETQAAIPNQHVVSMLGEGPMRVRFDRLGVPVTCLGMRRRHGALVAIGGLSHWVKALRCHSPDVLVSWMYHANLLALTSRVVSRSTSIIWNIRHSLHDLTREPLLTRAVIRVGARLSGLPDRILYNSELSREQHFAIGYDSGRSDLFPNGFDTSRYAPDVAVRSRLRHSLGVRPAQLLIGHFARLHPMKNHALFLSMAAELHGESSLMFLMAGTGVELSNPEFAMMVDERGLRGRILPVGEISAVNEYMNACDAVCLTSSWGEAFPNVLGEAQLCGLPCITTDVGDAALLVREDGWVVAPQDLGGLVAAVRELIMLPSEERRVRGENARARMVAKYSIKETALRFRSTLDEVLSFSRMKVT